MTKITSTVKGTDHMGVEYSYTIVNDKVIEAPKKIMNRSDLSGVEIFLVATCIGILSAGILAAGANLLWMILTH